ncbi:hypothetical protein DH2020_030806 [Rehmannia glutinosa]|uniref:Potassium transporter n=1 Tax=Rehmannia glutinosa TaxID=99300 RepID=A0ABR0VJP7_REHGL
MTEEGSERESRGLASMDSMESRWVYQDEEGSEIDNDGDERGGGGMESPLPDSDDDDNAEQRLIRTGPRIDSFDVEALEVPGAQRNDFEVRFVLLSRFGLIFCLILDKEQEAKMFVEIDLNRNAANGYDQIWRAISSFISVEYGLKYDKDVNLGRRIVLAFQTLGVVFGDVGTSPLYTFSVMFSKAPVNGNEDVLGALSLVLYTLILISLIKYVLIVLWANDDGEGGTFALYSLICRHAKVSLLPNQLPSDARISSFRLKVPSAELERSLKIKERLEASLTLKKLLLMLVLAGTSMVIADGVVTPAMSVISAVGGLKIGVSGFNQDHVVRISVGFLIVLFSVQRYGTSKVGLVVGPALFIWFCSLGGIGIYNLVKYDTSVLRAFNPIHIYYYFKRNSTKAWYSLGGCLLCATGSEAMFADLCYFSVRSVQLTFAFLVLPCLVLGYLGQAAYLMENHADTTQAFFSSVPNGAFWPVFLIANVAALIASRAMTTATFSCIKQSTALGCFLALKLFIPRGNSWAKFIFQHCRTRSNDDDYNLSNPCDASYMADKYFCRAEFCYYLLGVGVDFLFFSFVECGDGSWIILVFAIVIFLIMYIWNYGSKLKYETEVKQKMSMDVLRELGPDLGTVRAPGIGLIYNELAKGVPAIFGHFLTTLPAVHSMIIFVCIKYVPVSVVPQSERFLLGEFAPKSYHIFRCVARYGYKDVRKENHQTFEQLLIESLEKFIRREAQERSLESDGDDDSDTEEERSFSRILVAPNGSVYSLGVPLLAEFKDTSKFISEVSTLEEGKLEPSIDPVAIDAEQSLEKELFFLRKAKESGVVYLLGHGDIRARKESWFIKKLVINYFYAFLRKNCRRGICEFECSTLTFDTGRHDLHGLKMNEGIFRLTVYGLRSHC